MRTCSNPAVLVRRVLSPVRHAWVAIGLVGICVHASALCATATEFIENPPATIDAAAASESAVRELLRRRLEKELTTALVPIWTDQEVREECSRRLATSVVAFANGLDRDLLRELRESRPSRDRHGLLVRWIQAPPHTRLFGLREPMRTSPPEELIEVLPQETALRLVLALQLDISGMIDAQRVIQSAQGPLTPEDRRSIDYARQKAFERSQVYGTMLASAIEDVLDDQELGERAPDIVGWLLATRSYEPHEALAFADAASALSVHSHRPVHAWVRGLLIARSELTFAQLCLSQSPNGTVSDDRRKEAQNHLDKAYSALVESERQRPGSVNCAVLHIEIAKFSKSPQHGSPDHWFEKSLEIDPTSRSAFDAMAGAMLHRHERSREDLMRFYQRVSERSQRDHGLALIIINNWLDEVSEDFPGILNDSQSIDTMIEALTPAMKISDSEPENQLARAYIAAFAFRGMYEQLFRQAVDPKGVVMPLPDEMFIRAAELSSRFTDELDPNAGSLIREARIAMRRGDYLAASEHAEAALRPGFADSNEPVWSELQYYQNAPKTLVSFARGHSLTLYRRGWDGFFAPQASEESSRARLSADLLFTHTGGDHESSDMRSYVSTIDIGQRYVLTGEIVAAARADARDADVYGRIELALGVHKDDLPPGMTVTIDVPRPADVYDRSKGHSVRKLQFRLTVDGERSSLVIAREQSVLDVDNQFVSIPASNIRPLHEWGSRIRIAGTSASKNTVVFVERLSVKKIPDDQPKNP